METLSKPHIYPFPPNPRHFMTPRLAAKFPPPLLRLTSTTFRRFAAAQIHLPETTLPEPSTSNSTPKVPSRASKIIDAQQLKLNWLDSLSCPYLDENKCLESSDFGNVGSEPSGWVMGIDPDLSGALALLKPNDSPQVFDSPHLKVLIGKGVRKRLDAKSIVQLIQSFNAPFGRAEALLIAAYGKGLKANLNSSCTLKDLTL